MRPITILVNDNAFFRAIEIALNSELQKLGRPPVNYPDMNNYYKNFYEHDGKICLQEKHPSKVADTRDTLSLTREERQKYKEDWRRWNAEEAADPKYTPVAEIIGEAGLIITDWYWYELLKERGGDLLKQTVVGYDVDGSQRVEQVTLDTINQAINDIVNKICSAQDAGYFPAILLTWYFDHGWGQKGVEKTLPWLTRFDQFQGVNDVDSEEVRLGFYRERKEMLEKLMNGIEAQVVARGYGVDSYQLISPFEFYISGVSGVGEEDCHRLRIFNPYHNSTGEVIGWDEMSDMSFSGALVVRGCKPLPANTAFFCDPHIVSSSYGVQSSILSGFDLRTGSLSGASEPVKPTTVFAYGVNRKEGHIAIHSSPDGMFFDNHVIRIRAENTARQIFDIATGAVSMPVIPAPTRAVSP